MDGYRDFLISTLRTGMDQVAGLLEAFPPDSVDRELRPGEWNVRRHAHHLRQVEGRYLERLEGVLAAGAHVPAPVVHAEPDGAEPVVEMLAGFVSLRRRAIDVYEGLNAAQWSRRFNHPTIWGDVTVEWWAERFAQHTAEHIHGLWMLKQLAGLTPEAYARVAAGGGPP